MSLDNLPTRANGSAIDETWFNRIKKILGGAVAPRNSSGTVEAAAGRLGSDTFRWRRAHVASGYLFPGAIKAKYKYDGVTIPAEAGWMLMDGRIVNEANYDAEHGAGAWDDHGMSASPIAGLYLPNSDDRFLRGITGETGSTQDGSSPILFSGNADIDIEHNHGSQPMTTTAPNGNTSGGTKNDLEVAIKSHTHTVSLLDDTTNVDCRPLAIEANMFMRII